MGWIHYIGQKILGKAKEVLPEERQEQLVQTTVPLMLKGLRQYFRLKIEGLDNIPRTGPAIIIANHSGVTALDAVLLAYEIFEKRKRVARIISHRLWFVQSRISELVKQMGLVEATKGNAGKHLKKGNIIILFPEGEKGNFKPSSKAYHLREFKRGFVRLALQLKVPVIPVAIIGAEEANINLREIKILEKQFGITIPVPANILPLPSKWHLRVMPALKWSVDPEFELDLDDPRVKTLAHRARKNIMHEIRKMLEERGNPYL